tara:strand:- start:8 stop:547 length:540 start_codon:yes stop_codon:yes gene_type:complete
VQTFLTLVVYAVMTVVVIKLYLLARRKAKEAKSKWKGTRWRRRIGLFLFFGPAIAWILSFIVPQPLMPLVDAIRIFSRALDRILAGVLGVAGDNLGGVWSVLLRPLASMVIYTGAGIVLGWPFDYLAELKERQAGGASQEDAPELASGDGSADVPEGAPAASAEPGAEQEASQPRQESP